LCGNERDEITIGEVAARALRAATDDDVFEFSRVDVRFEGLDRAAELCCRLVCRAQPIGRWHPRFTMAAALFVGRGLGWQRRRLDALGGKNLFPFFRRAADDAREENAVYKSATCRNVHEDIESLAQSL
jgi:hypothetical protein